MLVKLATGHQQLEFYYCCFSQSSVLLPVNMAVAYSKFLTKAVQELCLDTTEDNLVILAFEVPLLSSR